MKTGAGNFFLRTVLFAVCASAFILNTAAAKDPEPPQIVGVHVGLSDRYKTGVWTQVDVVLRGGDELLLGVVSVIAPDGDGVPGRSTTPASHACQLLPGQTQTVRLLTRFGNASGELTIEFQSKGRKPVRRTFLPGEKISESSRFLPALEFQKLVAVVGDSTLGVDAVGKLESSNTEHWPIAARIGDVEQLPTRPEAYEGLYAVMISTARPELFAKLTANNARIEALDQWVRQGGRLIFCVGAAADEILAKDAPLARFAPGRFDKLVTLRQTGALEAYAESRLPIGQNNSRVSLRTPRLTDVQGVIEADEAGLPLVVRTKRGFGQVLFFAADLDISALGKWPDRSRLTAKLLDLPLKHEEDAKADAAMSHYGFSDLAGQLRSALDHFNGVKLVQFWIVAALIIGYILLIGPGDFFFLRKVVRRMEWTWLTFPLIVATVCIVAYFLAYKLKGDQLRVHQIDLVDMDASTGQMRGAMWANIFSPRMEAFDLSIAPTSVAGRPIPKADAWFAWFGLQGSAFGGMNAHGGGELLGGDMFQYAVDFNGMYNVPIQVWSTKSFTGRWSAPCDNCPQAELTADDRLVTGSITNTLPFALEKCILAYGESAYELGRIAPGATVPLGTMSKRSELKTLLTGQKAVFSDTGDKVHQTVTQFEQSNVEPAYVLRAMMFYKASGGYGYSRLWNDYQTFVDLSDLLKTGVAILVAEQPVTSGDGRHAAELLRDGHPLDKRDDQHSTMYRFIFPVKRNP